MSKDLGLPAVAAGFVFVFVLTFGGSVFSQPTGTLVDPSVPAGVEPNPHTLEGAQLPAAAPTPRTKFRAKILPPGNKKNHVNGESFAAPVQNDPASKSTTH